MKSKGVLSLALVVIFAMNGCVLARQSVYNVSAKNVGAVQLKGVRLQFEGFTEDFGDIVPGEQKQFSDHRGRFPNDVTLWWRVDGVNVEQSLNVSVPKNRPPLASRDQEYELRFDLDGSKAHAEFVVHDYTQIHQ